MDSWKIAVTTGAISFASSFKTIDFMASGPATLEGLNPVKSFEDATNR